MLCPRRVRCATTLPALFVRMFESHRSGSHRHRSDLSRLSRDLAWHSLWIRMLRNSCPARSHSCSRNNDRGIRLHGSREWTLSRRQSSEQKGPTSSRDRMIQYAEERMPSHPQPGRPQPRQSTLPAWVMTSTRPRRDRGQEAIGYSALMSSRKMTAGKRGASRRARYAACRQAELQKSASLRSFHVNAPRQVEHRRTGRRAGMRETVPNGGRPGRRNRPIDCVGALSAWPTTPDSTSPLATLTTSS